MKRPVLLWQGRLQPRVPWRVRVRAAAGPAGAGAALGGGLRQLQGSVRLSTAGKQGANTGAECASGRAVQVGYGKAAYDRARLAVQQWRHMGVRACRSALSCCAREAAQLRLHILVWCRCLDTSCVSQLTR